ncbi:DUF1329 domain-containing protein [Aromatoleum toluclasticum]|uniref:DUF1329 domain-containing protein n=1 Tax=Aromatoleum toluclasticum TaxID=92003 RepID=UPI001D19406C|nr:DUF1329 domain-containing protein [Aromatoleum toluclasticum]MCC4114775.1 DUF1329 domain-containing protein [Aromatoleum toluclasticum]
MQIKRCTTLMTVVLAGTVQMVGAADDADKLGKTVTQVGAEIEGNADGSIPRYTGGLTKKDAPPGFDPKSGRWVDPYAAEKPVLSITAQNLAQYQDKLSEATRELIKRFPESFRVNVYPTHRAMGYPERFNELTKANVGRCQMVENGLSLKGCFGGVPFPFPKNGMEVMWNNTTAPKPGHYSMISQGMYVDANGTPIQCAVQDTLVDSPYHDLKSSLAEYESGGQRYFRAMVKQLAPARIAGDGNMLTYTTDPVAFKNQFYQYQQGNRRVRVSPEAQYDFPTTVSGGAAFYDEIGLFLGKMDRYDWKLVGKKEMYIPYNTQRTLYTKMEDLTSAGSGRHPNPDLIRWELHRVWVVEAALKAGERHASPKRRYYIDEDNYGAGMMDSWDKAGKLHKLVTQLPFMAYDLGTPVGTATLTYDLSTSVYYLNTQFAEPNHGIFPRDTVFTASTWSPEGLARRSAR